MKVHCVLQDIRNFDPGDLSVSMGPADRVLSFGVSMHTQRTFTVYEGLPTAAAAALAAEAAELAAEAAAAEAEAAPPPPEAAEADTEAYSNLRLYMWSMSPQHPAGTRNSRHDMLTR